MSAILREDPPDLSVTNQNISPGPRTHRPPLPREEPGAAIPVRPRPRVQPRGALRRLGNGDRRRRPARRSRTAFPWMAAVGARGAARGLRRRAFSLEAAAPSRPRRTAGSRSAAETSAPPGSRPTGTASSTAPPWEGGPARDLHDAPEGPESTPHRRQERGPLLRLARRESSPSLCASGSSPARPVSGHSPPCRSAAARRGRSRSSSSARRGLPTASNSRSLGSSKGATASSSRSGR